MFRIVKQIVRTQILIIEYIVCYVKPLLSINVCIQIIIIKLNLKSIKKTITNRNYFFFIIIFIWAATLLKRTRSLTLPCIIVFTSITNMYLRGFYIEVQRVHFLRIFLWFIQLKSYIFLKKIKIYII